jgi:hypothetical protein
MRPVAIMVWIIRVLIIGTFSMAGERLFSMADRRTSVSTSQAQRPSLTRNLSHPTRPFTPLGRPAPKPEPTYTPVGMSASPRDSDTSVRR